MQAPAPGKCLICEGARLSESSTLTGSELRILWDALGNPVGDAAFGPITRDTPVHLYRCDSCGFRFYNPEFAGSAEFYEELMATKTYPLGSTEFSYAIDFARKNGVRRIMDVGGGEGAFLDLAKKSGFDTWGVELNRHASEVASSRGHRMFNKTMEEITTDELEGGADMLTLFQVVEHVSSPVPFLTSASALVRPGGYIAIAVPSDRRMLGVLDNDPADWPPHHVSRWRIEDLTRLAARTGLKVVDHGADPLHGGSIPWAMDLHRKLQTAIGRRAIPLGNPLVSGLASAYRALRLKHVLPFHGLSIYAVLQKPSA